MWTLCAWPSFRQAVGTRISLRRAIGGRLARQLQNNLRPSHRKPLRAPPASALREACAAARPAMSIYARDGNEPKPTRGCWNSEDWARCQWVGVGWLTVQRASRNVAVILCSDSAVRRRLLIRPQQRHPSSSPFREVLGEPYHGSRVFFAARPGDRRRYHRSVDEAADAVTLPSLPRGFPRSPGPCRRDWSRRRRRRR